MEVWHFGDLGIPPFSISTANWVSHAFEAEQTQHVFFVGTDREIYEIWWPRGGGSTLTALTKGADASGPITSITVAIWVEQEFCGCFGRQRSQLKTLDRGAITWPS